MKRKISIFSVSMGAGGAEKVISILLPILVDDYKVTLFLLYDDFHYSIPDNVEIITLFPNNNNSFIRRLFSVPIAFVKYGQYLKRNHIDASISFLFRPNIVSGMVALFNSRTKFIISERNYPSMEYKRGSHLGFIISRFLLKLFYNRADILFSNSEYINKDLAKNFGIKIPMRVIYNPIEITSIVHNPKKEVSKIVTVGRFEKVKNHMLLFNVIKQMPHHSLTIWGDGALRNDYEDMVIQLEIEGQVNLPGKTNDVLRVISRDDIFILSSDSEGFPNALLEAMSVGLPVIATNCLSGPLELLNDNEDVIIPQGGFYQAKFGVLVNTGDVEGLIKSINFLSDNYAKRMYYAKKSRERAVDYSLPTIYEQLKKII
ncbi:glycosyltransferase [Porphyromonadaceae bacterium W3.11]|nr:glycosyltransferase [Porphyromonadaceae bacterium W3.11]